MKKTNILAAAIALTLSTFMLTACGKSEFGIIENTEKRIVISADRADKDDYLMAGSLEVSDGEQIAITSDLKKGSIRVELIREPEGQSIDELPEFDIEPTITANLKSTDGAWGTVAAGSYMMKAICLEKATGTVQIEVKPYEGEGAPKDEGATTSEAVTAEPAESLEIETDTVIDTTRKDGERFEDTITIEGMEETVQYEHLRNDAIGIEMDYDYEKFVRRSEPDRECFISIYDDPENPENYLEVTYSDEDADTASASISETLSKDYEIIVEPYTLYIAGECTRIDASEEKGGGKMPDKLQMVYIVPAEDGCRIITAHYNIEDAEGFGKRFSYMAKSLAVIDRSTE